MVYRILRLLYGAWLLGTAVFALLALADVIFGEGEPRSRFVRFGKRIVLVLLWPLALLSGPGRELLLYQLRRTQL